jgi:hypothetical protein
MACERCAESTLGRERHYIPQMKKIYRDHTVNWLHGRMITRCPPDCTLEDGVGRGCGAKAHFGSIVLLPTPLPSTAHTEHPSIAQQFIRMALTTLTLPTPGGGIFISHLYGNA